MTTLAKYAANPEASRGRKFKEADPQGRNQFQRDRDRIIHSSAFRRLEYKTQVFVNHEGDLFRTRLTHSIEVAQIGRAIARNLQLHEDLVEGIALAHDLGHTPFGHAGQDALNECMREFGGFEHNLQSLRVVDLLERRYAEFDGLNLTFELREGILKHCSLNNAKQLGDVGERFINKEQPSLEAQLTNFADEIAYNNHDVDDGVRSGLIQIEQLSEVSLWRSQRELVQKRYPQLVGRRMVCEVVRHIIHVLVDDLVKASQARLEQLQPQSLDEVRRLPKIIDFSEAMREQAIEMKRFLFKNLYRHEQVLMQTTKAAECVKQLFTVYLQNPQLIPADFRPQDELTRRISHYIAGMTDRYAEKEFLRHLSS